MHSYFVSDGAIVVSFNILVGETTDVSVTTIGREEGETAGVVYALGTIAAMTKTKEDYSR